MTQELCLTVIIPTELLAPTTRDSWLATWSSVSITAPTGGDGSRS